MSAALAPAPAAAPAPAPSSPGRWRLLVGALAVAVLAVALRWWRADMTFDVFVDEFFYTDLGSSVRDGGVPRSSEGPFFLHPPGFFYLLGAWQEITRPDPALGSIAGVFHARGLNALAGGVTAALVVHLVGRRSLPWGLLAGLVLALEPFVLRQNARVLLDTVGVAWVLVGVALLQPLGDRPRRHWRAVAGGVAFGCAVLTKDNIVMLTVLPLVLLWWLRPHQRPWIPTALVSVTLPYALYLASITLTGLLDEWLGAKTGGLRRALGLEVTTGFTADDAPPLLDQILRQLADFGATYVLLGLGTVSAVVLLWEEAEDLALIALVHIGGFAMLAYSATAGTLEEHFLYYLLVPSILTVFGAAARPAGSWALRSPPRRRGAHRIYSPVRAVVEPVLLLLLDLPTRRGVTLAITALVLVLDALTYVRWHTQRDDGLAQVRQHLVDHAPPGTGVLVVQGTSEFAFGDRYDVGPYTEDEERVRHDVQYLVVPWREVEQGYTYVSAETLRDLLPEAELVLSHTGRTYGEVALYRLPPPVGTTVP